MLQARAHLQSASGQALRRPAAAGWSSCSSGSGSSSMSAYSTVSPRAGAHGRAQRRWKEPQVARLQWSIECLPIGSTNRAGPLSWADTRRHASTGLATPPPPADVIPPKARPPPRLRASSSAPSTPPPPLVPSPPPQRTQRTEPIAQTRPLPSQFPVPAGARLALSSRDSVTAQFSSPTSPLPPSSKLTSSSEAEETPAETRQLVMLSSADPDLRPQSGRRSDVHPASFFGPQTDRHPVRISAFPQLSPVVSLNSLIPHPAKPWAGAHQRFIEPAKGLTPLESSGSFIALPRHTHGRWLSRSPTGGRRPELATLDGRPFRSARRLEAAADSTNGFALARTADPSSIIASNLVNESMELMSFPALAAPYLRPDADPLPADRSPAAQELTSNLTRRIMDQAIRVHCVAFRIEEALELFAHAYPGWLPWLPAPVRPRPQMAEVDERVLFSLSDGLVKTGNAGRARLFLQHVRKIFNFKPSAAFYYARMRVDIGLKDYAAAQHRYKTLAEFPGQPLDNDRRFGAAVLRTLMRIGKLTNNPQLTLHWFNEAQKTHGIEPGLRELRQVLDAYAKVHDATGVASVWRVVQTLPVKTPADHRLYTLMFDTCLRLYAATGSGTSFAHVSYFVGQAIASRKLTPTPNTFATVMRVAAEEENFDAARDILRTMESGELNGQKFPADVKHYEALLLALDRQMPHARKSTEAAALRGEIQRHERLTQRDRAELRTRDNQAAELVLERVLDLVLEMKERDLPLSGSILVRLTRLLAYRANTRPEAIRLAMSLLASLPTAGEGWSARNLWAMIGGGDDGFGGSAPASRVFSVLIKTLSASQEVEKYKTALQAFDHFLQMVGPDELSVVDVAVMLSLAGRSGETQYIERLWELALARALATKTVVGPPTGGEQDNGKSRAGQLPSIGPPSFFDQLHIELPEPSPTPPFAEHIGPAMVTLFRVINQHITPESLLFLEKEWLRVYQLDYGFDAGSWCELARAYLSAGRYERGFQILNDVVLFHNNRLLAEFERVHGMTVPDAPSFAGEQDESASLLSDEIQRAPPHYQDMVLKSYKLPSPERVGPLARRGLLLSMSRCANIYGPASSDASAIASPARSISPDRIIRDRKIFCAFNRAVSWSPAKGIADALEEAQATIRAEALRQWNEDPPELDGENPLQRAERFFANYPRVAQLLAIRRARGVQHTQGAELT